MKTIPTPLALALVLGLTALPLAAQTNAPAAEANAPATESLENRYQLRPMDKLLFSIAEDPVKAAQPDEMLVSSLGEISFRVSRDSELSITLDVRGKTLAQVKEELVRRLEEDYYHRATVNLRLRDTSPILSKVLFFGAVGGNVIQFLPGERKTLFEAILQVGTTEWANRKKVRLSRINAETGKDEIQIIDVEAIQKDRSKDIPLQDGDRIEVPERGFVF